MKLFAYFKSIFRYSPGKISGLLIFMLIAGALEGLSYTLFLPLLKVMTHANEAGSTASYFGFSFTFAQILLFILAVFAVKNLFIFFERFLSSKLALEFERDLKKEILDAYFSSDWKFYLSEKMGTLTNVMGNQARLAADAFKVFTLLSTELVNVLIYCVIGIYISPPAFAVSLFAGAVTYYLLRNVATKSRAIGSEALVLKNESIGRVIEDFSGIKFIKASRLEDYRKHKVFELYSRVLNVELRGEKFSAIMDSLPDFIMAAVVCSILYFSYFIFKVPAESLLVLILVMYRMNRRVMAAQSFKQRFFLYLPSYEACRDIIRRAVLLKEKTGSQTFEGLRSGLSFKNVTFTYGRHMVFTDVSLEIKKNQITAVVGRSGSGKTTLVDMMLGLLKPDQGSIQLDGTPLERYDLHSLRSKIGIVSQDVFLVNASVRENITMGLPDVTQEALEKASRLAYADEFIKKLPLQYDTLIGDRGTTLSGGQRQRLALARALLRSPELLILDEATSALDSESEHKTQLAIEALRGKMTIFIVAHRLSTIERADVIYVLNEGRMEQSGTLEKLKSQSETFQKIYNL